ncbi:DUF2798 domain-containing protein [Vibrio fortis]|jgi:uncharacterized protein (DUF983 family)|uniref:DUF2798 domain-containing protein n=1 Tax=Vibrio fortis TaxID=212667 RepID=A0A066UKM3_9VIBR|nr:MULTISPECIES: DUF2798 domain-containing protein [Vibrio]KAB0301347.1 DUF2798 domain-containing protein [Vibrio fortis]KDN26437.1 MFS transporter permease [Vibrio fortis]MDK9761946.1 DUF2798 domain-containing protein [Vibrio sp. D420a]QFT11924.1 hypothetical protein FIV04_18520 [Vibrio sp. THAF190c]|tara:strand:+ start:76 stop:333 length:258 start_codon:yes stop_codon:yes gene_type:complete
MNKKLHYVTATLSSLVMAVLMSGIISGTKMGFSHDWPPVWLNSFLLAWPCALVLSLTLLPKVKKLAEWICKPRESQPSQVGLCDE